MRGWQNVMSFFFVTIGSTARAQLSKDQSIQIKGVRRVRWENPFRTIETALFEKVNFRKIFFLVGKPSAQGIKFSLLI